MTRAVLKSPDKRRRRQPRQERAKVTVEAIIEAAARVLEREGYDNTNTNLIAAEAGVSIGTLYEYFADKDALSHAVLERCANRKLEQMMLEVPQIVDMSAGDAVRRLIEKYVELVASQCDLTRTLLGRAIYVPVDEEPDDIAQGFAGVISALLETRRDELRCFDVEMVSFVLVHTLNGTIEGTVLHRPEYIRDPRLVEELTTLVWRYVMPE